jgi:osmoprotectant transport system substrate-binding protein
MNFAEQLVLGELYAQALEARGFPVERQLNLGSRESVEPALEAGRIDVYPEYLATMLAFVTRGTQRGDPDPRITHQQLGEAIRQAGLTALDYAPAVNTNGFVVTWETAQRFKLTRISDLAPVAGQLVLGGPPECPVRPFCLVGLRTTYGVAFKDFRILDAGGPMSIAALENGQVDVALLFTTDPLIQARNLVLLEDDRRLQLADNVAPVVRTDVLNRASPDLRTALNAVSAQLTTEELTALNARVQPGGQQPAQVAADWLRARGLRS